MTSQCGTAHSESRHPPRTCPATASHSCAHGRQWSRRVVQVFPCATNARTCKHAVAGQNGSVQPVACGKAATTTAAAGPSAVGSTFATFRAFRCRATRSAVLHTEQLRSAAAPPIKHRKKWCNTVRALSQPARAQPAAVHDRTCVNTTVASSSTSPADRALRPELPAARCANSNAPSIFMAPFASTPARASGCVGLLGCARRSWARSGPATAA